MRFQSFNLLLLAAAARAATTHNVAWQLSPPQTTYYVAVGDTVTFSWSGIHNVLEAPDQTAYDACDVSGATAVSSGASTSASVSFPTVADVGTKYYYCTVGGGSHCSSGQKITVHVSAATIPNPRLQAAPPPAAATAALQPAEGRTLDSRPSRRCSRPPATVCQPARSERMGFQPAPLPACCAACCTYLLCTHRCSAAC